MRMDSQWNLNLLLDRFYDLDELEGHCAPICVAQDDAVHIGLFSSLQCLDCIFGVGLVPVKKMLGVINDLWRMGLQVHQGIIDKLQIFLQ